MTDPSNVPPDARPPRRLVVARVTPRVSALPSTVDRPQCASCGQVH